MGFAMQALSGLAVVFVLAIGLMALAAVIMFVADLTQTQDAIRRNYPVIGRFRHLFSSLGEFFRQYFFAMDREELPFNRAQRHWIERAAEGESNTIAFGSTRNLVRAGHADLCECAVPAAGRSGGQDRAHADRANRAGALHGAVVL